MRGSCSGFGGVRRKKFRVNRHSRPLGSEEVEFAFEMAPPVEGLTECLYETLGVERSVNPDKLKIAYRKMAMKWHPDKIQQSGAGASPEDYQKATERFQMINRAYEVLSDPVERTWYDSHRERILNASSSSNSANATPGEFDLNLWPYFSPSAYSGFGETGSGFYAVYSEVFRKVHMQEQVFGRMYGNGDVSAAPELGGKETPYQTVYSFYRYWQGFSTVKDFAWCDKYDVLQAPNRKVRRLMDEENNKVRKRERKEFNNSVRQLASFVKKRDKRVIEKQLELQMIQKQKEQERKARQLALEREKQEQIRLYKEQAWTVPSDQEEEWDSDEDSDYDGTAKLEKTTEELECMICSKRFKSVKQLQNHERSKKHLENLAALKGAFRNDDEQVERLGKELGIDVSSSRRSKKEKANEGSSGAQEPAADSDIQSGLEGKDPNVGNSSCDDGPEVEVENDAEPLRMPMSINEIDADPSLVSIGSQSDDSIDDTIQALHNEQEEMDVLPIEPVSDEEEISDVEEDDHSMLASMLKLQRSRWASAVPLETVSPDDSRGSVEKGRAESSPDDEEADEDDMIAAMSSIQLNKQKASSSAMNFEASQLEDTGNDSVEKTGVTSRNEESVVEDGEFDDDEKPKKGKSRRRAKQDRKQAAISNRFTTSDDLEQPESVAHNGNAASDAGGPSIGANENVRAVKEIPLAKHSKVSSRGKKIKKEKVTKL